MVEDFKTVGIMATVIEIDGDPSCNVTMNFENGWPSNGREITMPSFRFKFRCEYWHMAFTHALSQFPPHNPLREKEPHKEANSCVGCMMRCAYRDKYNGEIVVVDRSV